MTTKAELNARVKIAAGPAAGLYGRISAVDTHTWKADVALDDGRTAKGIPMKHVELIAEEQVTDRAKLLDRIRKLWAKAESLKQMGPEYEAEAMTFAANAQKMLAKYKLSLDDLAMAQMEKDEPIGASWEDGSGGRNAPWAESLAAIVARAHFCRVLFSTRARYDHIYIIGRETDRKIAGFVYATLKRAAEEMSDKAARKFRKELRQKQGATDWDNKNYRTAWLNGFVERIAERYRDEERQMEREQIEAKGTSLVLVRKNALAAADEFMQNVKTVRGKSRSGRSAGRSASSTGREHGRAAANDVNIRGTGLGGASSSNRGLLN